MEFNMQKYDIAAYIWPSYTGKEFRARQFWPDGIGEWQTVMSVPSRMPLKPADYEWDRKPLWGCCDECVQVGTTIINRNLIIESIHRLISKQRFPFS